MLLWILSGCLPELEPPAGSEGPELQCNETNRVEEEGEGTVWLGLLEERNIICGELSSTGNNGSGYTGDRDRLDFSPGRNGTWLLSLDWESAEADYDFYLLAAETNMEIQSSAGTAWPQEMEVDLMPDLEYRLIIVGWSGPAGEWSMSLAPPQQ